MIYVLDNLFDILLGKEDCWVRKIRNLSTHHFRTIAFNFVKDVSQ